MDRNNSYFLVSGFISLTLFAFFLSLFFYMMFSSSKLKEYALNKDNYISVSIQLPKEKKTKSKKSVATPLVNPPQNKQTQEVDIDDLFSDVWTKNIKTKKINKKKIDKKRIQDIQKKIKTTTKNKTENISQKLQQITSNKADNENVQTSSADEVNEYLAKIQALVYKYFYPPANSQGHSVKAVINLSALGKVLDFRILQKSANMALNEESEKIKERLMSVVFPKNPQNKSGNYIIILTSKE